MPEPRTAAQWQERCELLQQSISHVSADCSWLGAIWWEASRRGHYDLAKITHTALENARERLASYGAELDAAIAARDAAIIGPDRPLVETEDAVVAPDWPFPELEE